MAMSLICIQLCGNMQSEHCIPLLFRPVLYFGVRNREQITPGLLSYSCTLLTTGEDPVLQRASAGIFMADSVHHIELGVYLGHLRFVCFVSAPRNSITGDRFRPSSCPWAYVQIVRLTLPDEKLYIASCREATGWHFLFTQTDHFIWRAKEIPQAET